MVFRTLISDSLKIAISKHLKDFEHAKFILDINNLYDNLNSSDINQPDILFSHFIRASTKILIHSRI